MTAMDNLAFKIDQLFANSTIKAIMDKVAVNQVDADALKNSLALTFQSVEDQLKDGFQLTDVVPILSAALQDVMLVAEKLMGASGEDKLTFVTEVFTGLYNIVDKGVDGTKNRIDIPWVPQVAEDFIERKLLPVVIHFAVEAVISVWNKKNG